MKLSRTALKELTAAYRAVLRHGILCNAIALGLVAVPAMAERLAIEGGNPITETDKVYSNNSGQTFGGGIDNYGGNVTEINVTIQGNAANRGGGVNNDGVAIFNGGLIGGTTAGLGNQGSGGGAIANTGTLTINGTTIQNNVATNYGGGIYNSLNASGTSAAMVSVSNATLKGNSAGQFGGAIYSQGTKDIVTGALNITTSNFFNNSAANTKAGGAIYLLDSGNVTIKGAKFGGYDETDPENPISLGNTAGKGGAVYIGGVNAPTHGEATVTITKDESNNKTIFDHNVANGAGAEGYGGALVHNGYKTFLDLSNAEFTNNSATNQAGALLISVTAGTLRADGLAAGINNVLFANNTSAGQGGAMWNGAVAMITNTEFNNNSTTGNGEGGGAVDLGAVSKTAFDNVTFTSNTAASSGGAIATRNFSSGQNANAKLDIYSTTFKGNSAAMNGGAIYNNFYNSIGHTGSVYVSGATFGGTGTGEGNSAANGGAIYNNADGTQTGNMYITNSTFTGNFAVVPDTYTGATYKKEGVGGAIASSGSLTINASTFTGNTARTTGSGWGLGGALSTVTVDGFATDMTIIGSTFTGNSADVGGAVYGMLKATNQHGLSTITISGSTFEGNSAQAGSAIANFDIMSVSDTTFSGNTTFNIDDGGTVFLGSESITSFTGGDFTDNESNTVGGAIATRSINNDNSYAKLDIVDTTFKGNSAGTNGGAIDNNFYDSVGHAGSVYVSGATFGGTGTGEGNSAANGGAIYNHANATRTGSMYLTGVNFFGNTATTAGGAIYNEGVITLAADNTFKNNKAGGVANDIYNDGTLNIASGTTTLDGGVTGNGTLNIASGATLNIGSATVSQGTINLGGTLIADLVSGADPIFTATTFEGTGNLSLAIEKEGTYNLFGNAVFANAQQQITSTFYDLDWTTNDGKTVIATKKSADKIAEETGLTTESAVAVSHIVDAGSSDTGTKQIKELSVAVQEKLASGNTAAIEQATKAVHPEKEAVVQSVSASVQHAVVNLAANRMSMPRTRRVMPAHNYYGNVYGRNGGDVNFTSGGIWAQGLFNKSRQHDAFNGYTRGIAFGLDGTINRHWTIGAGYSYAHSDIDGTARNTEIDSNTLFLYGQYKPAQWYVNAIANYTMSDYSEIGTIIDDKTIFADYKVNSFGGALATGYDFRNGITPELGLRYIHVSADDYANSYGVKTHMDDNDFLTGVIGAKYAFNVDVSRHTKIMPQLNAGFKYDLLSDKQIATVAMPGINAYTIEGNRLNRIGGEFGIGLGMQYRTLEMSVNYDIDVREDYTSQTGMLKFRYNF